MRLSALDRSVACAGRGDADAMRDTLTLAVNCAALGCERFWVSEHHGLPTLVGCAPEVLGPLQRPVDIAAQGWRPDERPAALATRRRALAGELALDHIGVDTGAHDPAVRRRSYELLAAEFGPAPQ